MESYLKFHLLKELLPAVRSDCACQTVELVRREKHKFTALDMSPPISPDIKLGSDARMSLPHASTGHGRSAAEGDEHLSWLSTRCSR